MTLAAEVRPTSVGGLAALLADPPQQRSPGVAGLGPSERSLPEPPEVDRATLRLPVVCVPGFTGSKEDFGHLLGLLAAAGHRAVAIDQRGQYQSSGPDDPACYSTDALAADLRVVLEATGRQTAGRGVHLVGHSYGGIVARRTALADTAGIASLTLLGSGPAAVGGRRAQLIELMRPVLAEGGLAAVFEASEAVGAAHRNGPDERPAEVVQFLRRRFLATNRTALEVMGEALLSEPDLVAELGRLDLPLLVAHGEGDDAWAPEVQREMATGLGAAYAVIGDSQHSPAAESPQRTAQVLLDFFSTVPGRRHRSEGT
jgi:pimeloyl-ACP methyl ester carboxylesterase